VSIAQPLDENNEIRLVIYVCLYEMGSVVMTNFTVFTDPKLKLLIILIIIIISKFKKSSGIK